MYLLSFFVVLFMFFGFFAMLVPLRDELFFFSVSVVMVIRLIVAGVSVILAYFSFMSLAEEYVKDNKW